MKGIRQPQPELLLMPRLLPGFRGFPERFVQGDYVSHGSAGANGKAGFIRQDPERAVELPDESGVPVAARECAPGGVWS